MRLPHWVYYPVSVEQGLCGADFVEEYEGTFNGER